MSSGLPLMSMLESRRVCFFLKGDGCGCFPSVPGCTPSASGRQGVKPLAVILNSPLLTKLLSSDFIQTCPQLVRNVVNSFRVRSSLGNNRVKLVMSNFILAIDNCRKWWQWIIQWWDVLRNSITGADQVCEDCIIKINCLLRSSSVSEVSWLLTAFSRAISLVSWALILFSWDLILVSWALSLIPWALSLVSWSLTALITNLIISRWLSTDFPKSPEIVKTRWQHSTLFKSHHYRAQMRRYSPGLCHWPRLFLRSNKHLDQGPGDKTLWHREEWGAWVTSW